MNTLQTSPRKLYSTWKGFKYLLSPVNTIRAGASSQKEAGRQFYLAVVRIFVVILQILHILILRTSVAVSGRHCGDSALLTHYSRWPLK